MSRSVNGSGLVAVTGKLRFHEALGATMDEFGSEFSAAEEDGCFKGLLFLVSVMDIQTGHDEISDSIRAKLLQVPEDDKLLELIEKAFVNLHLQKELATQLAVAEEELDKAAQLERDQFEKALKDLAAAQLKLAEDQAALKQREDAVAERQFNVVGRENAQTLRENNYKRELATGRNDRRRAAAKKAALARSKRLRKERGSRARPR